MVTRSVQYEAYVSLARGLITMASKKSLLVNSPNLGLYLGIPSLEVPKRGLRDCLNMRIKERKIIRDNVGWGPFPEDAVDPLNLDNKPVTLIESFFLRDGGQATVFGNTTDVFLFNEGPATLSYLTPRYETGTVAVTNGDPEMTGTGTSWADNAKIGDFIHVGATGQVDPTEDWYEVTEVAGDVIQVTPNYTGVTASGLGYTLRQAQTGTVEDYYETALFYSAQNLTVGVDGDRWYGTNGVDSVLAWNGTDDQMYRPDLGGLETARSLAVYKNTMIYININVSGDNRPFSARTSAIGRPEDVATLEASEFIIHSGADPLSAAFLLGDNLVFYAERSITLAQFVGPPLMYVFRTIVDRVGPRNGRAIADYGDYHRFLGPDAQYSFDGVNLIQSNNHVWFDTLRKVSPKRFKRLLSHFDEKNGELLWVVPQNTDASPETGPPEQAYVEHYLEDIGRAPTPYTRRELPATAMGLYERVQTLRFSDILNTWADQTYRWDERFFLASFPFNLFGTETGDIFAMGTKDSKNGVAMRSYAKFGRRPLGDTKRKGVIQRIYPMTETEAAANYTLTVNIRTTDQPAGAMVLEKTQEYSLQQNTSRHFVSPRVSARYVEVEFETEGIGHAWTLTGYDMEVIPGSER